MRQNNKLKTLVATAAMAAAGSAMAGEYTPVINDKMPIEPPAGWSFCDIFDYGDLYEGDGFIKSVSLVGRYHGQYIDSTEDDGLTRNAAEFWQHRRFRLGLDVRFGDGYKFFAEANLANNPGLIQNRVLDNWQDFYIQKKWDDQYVTVGKQKLKNTREDTMSSKKIKTIERSQIVNEVAGQRPWGAVYGFKAAGASHELGAWLNGAGPGSGAGSSGKNWPDFDTRGAASYRFSKDISDESTFFFDYVYTNNSSGQANARGNAAVGLDSAYEHALSFGTENDFGRLNLLTDLIFGFNRESGGPIPSGDDTWGLVILPSYEITDKLELVGRYAYMASGREQRTQRFGSRQWVEDYHTFYVGLQYFICGENLKLMAGYEWADGQNASNGNDIDSGTALFGVRTYF